MQRLEGTIFNTVLPQRLRRKSQEGEPYNCIIAECLLDSLGAPWTSWGWLRDILSENGLVRGSMTRALDGEPVGPDIHV